jgi:hypothetical protein
MRVSVVLRTTPTLNRSLPRTLNRPSYSDTLKRSAPEPLCGLPACFPGNVGLWLGESSYAEEKS